MPPPAVAPGAVPAAVRAALAAAPVAAPTSDAGRPRISPSARELARKLGVDPTRIQGTGRGGAVTREDVERAAAQLPIAEKPAGPGKPPAADRQARMRQTIAAAMARSKREIPHYYLATTVDVQPALSWVGTRNAGRPVQERLLPGVLLLKAVALALREVPELNALWEEGQAVRKPDIHVGVAISLRGGGLVAPALHHTDQQGLDELMKNFRDLVTRARAGTLRSSELADPTITVTSLGDQGVETVFGIIYPPQAAIVGFGKIVERPWVVNGQVLARPVVTATLSGDHRVSDGHQGGRFLAAVARLLQEPEKL